MGVGWHIVPSTAVFRRLPSLRPRVLKQRVLLARAEDDRILLLLRLPRGWAALDADRFPLAPAAEHQRAWVLALQQSTPHAPSGGSNTVDEDEDPDDATLSPPLPPIPPEPATLHWQDGWPELTFGTRRLGCAMRPDSRDWAWAWSPTIGPVLLRLHLRRSAAEIEQFVAARGDWSPHPDGYWRSRHSADSRLALGPNYFSLSRGYHRPPDAQVAADHFLLLALADGALGEFTFDLFDGDYYVFEASGESGASLRDYLHARGRRERRHRWNSYPQLDAPIEARADTADETARQLARGLGWECASLDALCTQLQQAHVPDLPRRIEVLIREAAFPEEIRHRLACAQPRVQFHFQLRQD